MMSVPRLIALAVVCVTAGPAVAQYPQMPQFDPWYRGNAYGYHPFYNPYGPVYIPAPSRPPIIGYLPNGTPMINPWVRPAVVNPVTLYTQALVANQIAAAQFAAWQAVAFSQPVYGYGSGFNGFVGRGVSPAFGFNQVSIEPGRFLPYSRGLAVNPVSGTVLAPYRGVARTADGDFYRLPGTGTTTAFGSYVPGTGLYVNPITGARYNPATGVIVK